MNEQTPKLPEGAYDHVDALDREPGTCVEGGMLPEAPKPVKRFDVGSGYRTMNLSDHGHYVAYEDYAAALRERDLAIAHDRQPYPTAHAYDTVCGLLTNARARIKALEGQSRFLDDLAARDCENYNGSDCYKQGRRDDAIYGSDVPCWPCAAARALTPNPEKEV